MSMPLSPFSRRRFVRSTLASGAALSLPAWAQPHHASESASAMIAPATESFVLLGTQNGPGVLRASWNAATGQLGTPELAAAAFRPTFLVQHPTLPVVYACNEGDGDAAAFSAFTVDHATATLAPLAKQPTHGNSPCFGTVDRTGRLAFTANYGGGSLSVFGLDAQGVPGPALTVFRCAENSVCGPLGPVKSRQDAPHLHCAVLSPDNRFVLACDLGDDAILAFPIHPDSPSGVRAPFRIAARTGSGPRHLAFHPNGHWLFCIHELDCTVDLYTWHLQSDTIHADLVPDAMAVLAPATPNEKPAPGHPLNTAAEIVISRDGRFLYTCTRGVNILSVHSIDERKGHLHKLQELPCGGKTPRFFALDPTERWLLCTNQDDDTIAIFARDPGTGHLTPHNTVTAPSPMCVVWL